MAKANLDGMILSLAESKVNMNDRNAAILWLYDAQFHSVEITLHVDTAIAEARVRRAALSLTKKPRRKGRFFPLFNANPLTESWI